MASLVLARPDLIPSGTTASLFPASQRHPEGREPIGSTAAISTAVATDLNVTLTGAVDRTKYVVYALVNGVHTYVTRIQ